MTTPPATPQTPLNPKPAAAAAAEVAALQAAGKRSRRSFLVTGALGLAGLGTWNWLISQPKVENVPGPLRKVLEFNGQLTNEYYKNTRLAPEFARSRARRLRVNGDVGLGDDFDAAAWRLAVLGYGAAAPQPFSIEQIKALPRIEMTTELKCIEGWSTVVHWAGVRLSDFLARYPLATRSGRPADPAHNPADLAPYVSMQTPDGAYFVGLDMESALHPQTLLCYEMDGRPLTAEHGAPLRLVVPLKYGIKHIKRIGTMAFTQARPDDYWAKLGYDWHASH